MSWVTWLAVGGVAFIAVAFILTLVYYYNRIRVLSNRIEEGWAQIDVQLKKRYDLVPNLVETVKGYAEHERAIFEKVTEARERMVSGSREGRMEASNELTGVLRTLFAVAENYPDLKANQNFLSLQEELTSTENKISFSRQYYNDSVLGLNNKIQMFPSNIVAAMTGFKLGEFFEVTVAGEREAPKVSFA